MKDDSKNGYDQVVDSASVPATPLGSNPLHLQDSTQRTDVLHRQQGNSPKKINSDKEMSPTLPWPNHDRGNAQVGNPEGNHVHDRPCRSLESKSNSPAAAIIDSQSRDRHPGIHGREDVDEEPTTTTIQSQPHQKGSHPGQVQPQADTRQHDFPPACQKSVPSPPLSEDTRGALYSGGGQVPKLVTAESCAAEGIPDPRNNDSNELQHMYDLSLQSDAQEVLLPGPTLRRSARERKSRSVSVSLSVVVLVRPDLLPLQEVCLLLSPSLSLEMPRNS